MCPEKAQFLISVITGVNFVSAYRQFVVVSKKSLYRLQEFQIMGCGEIFQVSENSENFASIYSQFGVSRKSVYSLQGLQTLRCREIFHVSENSETVHDYASTFMLLRSQISDV